MESGNAHLVHAHGLTISTRVPVTECTESLSPLMPLETIDATTDIDDATTTDINALSDDLLAAIFSFIPFEDKVQVLQFVCNRWYKMHRVPQGPEMWRDLNLRVGNRYSSNDSVTHMNVEVMEDSCPCSPSHLLQSVPDFLQWLTPRACGFTVLQLIMDIELPWENEVEACRRALWFVMTNTVLPIIGLLSTSLKEIIITVADAPHGLMSQNALLYSAPSAVACFLHALGNLPKLDFLMLDCLGLQSVSAAFFADAPKHANLHVLILRACGLRSLPNLPALANTLTGLDLSCNPLSATWLSDCLPKLPRLQSLVLSNCSLTSIPAAVAHLRHLFRLFLSHNTFTGNEWAPLNLAMLTNLEELTISHCAITSLPETIGTLQSLRSLDVKANQLEVLISSLSALTNLQTLQLASNSFATIPEATLSTLTGLTMLDLSRQATRISTTDGVVLDLNSTVRVAAPLTLFPEALHKLRVLRLPTVELSDCVAHVGGPEDVAAVAKTVLHLNALRVAMVRGALARGETPPQVDAE